MVICNHQTLMSLMAQWLRQASQEHQTYWPCIWRSWVRNLVGPNLVCVILLSKSYLNQKYRVLCLIRWYMWVVRSFNYMYLSKYLQTPDIIKQHSRWHNTFQCKCNIEHNIVTTMIPRLPSLVLRLTKWKALYEGNGVNWEMHAGMNTEERSCFW